MCFAVTRGEIIERTDVNYAAMSNVVATQYSNPRYELTPLRELVARVQYGTSALANSEPVGLPVLRMNNLQDDGWDLSSLKYIELPEAEAESYRLIPGDLLFNRTNSKELVGKCGVFREEGHWIFASYLIRVSLNPTKALPDFISDFLGTVAGRTQIDRVSRRIVGMSNVNAEELRELQIPLPPLDIQAQLVQEMQDARAARAAKLKEADEALFGIDVFLLAELGLTSPKPDPRFVYAVTLKQIRAANHADADYFHPERILAIRAAQTHSVKGLHSAPLKDIADFVRDQVAASSHANYLGLANVQSNTGELVSTNDEVEGTCFLFQKGDVLFCRLRPYLNKVYCAESDGICSTEFYVMRVRTLRELSYEVLPDYLAVILRSSLTLAQTRHMMTGNTHPRLANEDVQNLVVPIPTNVDVQNRIVAELRARRKRARALREQAEMDWQTAKARFEAKLLGE